MEFLIVLVILAVVVFVITAPLRRERAADGPAGESRSETARVRDNDLAELGAAREAKYREIRDAELDRATGKLSEADFSALDATLRAQALAILDTIERLRPDTGSGDDQSSVGAAE